MTRPYLYITILVIIILLTSGCVSDQPAHSEERKEPPLPPPIPPITGEATATDGITGFTPSTDYPGFAVAETHSGINSQYTFSTTDQITTIPLTITDQFVYKQAFISLNGSGWIDINLTPMPAQEDYYIDTLANADIHIEPSNFTLDPDTKPSASNNYFAFYSCSASTASTCHDGWQIWQFDAVIEEAGPVTYTITASSYEIDPSHPPEDVDDGNLSTRWSAQGDGEWIQFEYSSEIQINLARIAFLSGDQRWANFSVEISDDGSVWNRIAEHILSSGTTNDLQEFPLPESNTRFVRLVGHGNENSDWNSITELNFTYMVPPEPTCLDGIKNQDETGIDCGGSLCDVCYEGTTYYVSNNTLSDDTNNGTQPYSPWKTMAKVNSESFEPGDAILFKRDDVWRETLVIPSSGTVEAFITFGAYGTGDKPKIIGSEQATDWTETSPGSDIWQSSTVVEDPFDSTTIIYWDDTAAEIFFVENNGDVNWGNEKKAAINDLATEYDWTWNSDNIYIYSPENPGTRYESVEIPQRIIGIEMNNNEYITIDGLGLFFTKKAGVRATYRGYYGTTLEQRSLDLRGYILRNCDIAYMARKDDSGYGTGVMYSDAIIENNVIHDVGRRSISLYNYALVDVSNITVQNNVLYNGFHTTGVDISAGSEDHTSGDVDNIIVRNNIIYDDPYKELVGGYGDGNLGSELNFISGTPPYGDVTGVYFYNNIFMHPSGASLHFENVAESYVFNNVFYGQNEYKTANNAHLLYDTGSKNITIKNNIIYGDSDYNTSLGKTSGTLFYISCGSGYTDTNYSDGDVNNNLYFQEDDRLRLIQLAPGGWDSKSVFCMKLWTSCPWGNFTDLRAKGWEMDSPDPADPLFVDAANWDFRLQAGSPAIGAGTAIPGVLIPGETTDRNGVPYNDPPSIGAYEYAG